MKRKAKAMGATNSSELASSHSVSPAAAPSASLSKQDASREGLAGPDDPPLDLSRKHPLSLKDAGKTTTKIKASGPPLDVSLKVPLSIKDVGKTTIKLFPIPLPILEEIFLNLPPHQVVSVCRLVCHQWRELANSKSLWRERCRREGYCLRNASRIPKDWMLFYFLCKKRRNLLKNPKGEHKMKNWEILENGGDNWKLEEVMMPHPNETVQQNFVTSFGMCKKSQLIDLAVEGYNPSLMDNFQPDIKVSDWYAPRWDCGSEYEIHVELLNERKKLVQTFAPEKVYFEQWNDQKWTQMTHVFQNYGPGVRFIRFTHGGKDTQFWKGWYGIRVTDSCVEISPAMAT